MGGGGGGGVPGDMTPATRPTSTRSMTARMAQRMREGGRLCGQLVDCGVESWTCGNISIDDERKLVFESQQPANVAIPIDLAIQKI